MDWQGNEYKTKNYGGTWWMVENMRTTRTKDGQNIWVSSQENKFSTTTPYCYFQDDQDEHLNDIGCLYNWTAANEICPDGWHLPTVSEYEALTQYLGSVKKYCYKNDPKAIAKAMAHQSDLLDGYGLWAVNTDPGTPGRLSVSVGIMMFSVDPNNASGFDAMPIGGYSPFLEECFFDDFYGAYFWLADENNTDLANAFHLYYDNKYVIRDTVDKTLGFSVRCVKD